MVANSSTNTNGLTGPLIAAAVVPTAVFALAVAAFFLWICVRRRKLRKLDENVPYQNMKSYSSASPGGCGGSKGSTDFVSQFVDSFVENPMDQWKRENAAKTQSIVPAGLTSFSLLSSNLSSSLRSFRNPLNSSASVVGNALSAPPLKRMNTNDSGM